MGRAAAPSFDLITCVGKAYSFVWAERAYLLRLALLPFIAKLFFFTLAYTYGGQENLVRTTLIMVPAWLVEGWMLAHFVRLILLGQRWPFIPTGNRAVDLPVLQSRYRGVMSGLVMYTFIQVIIGGWFALLMYAVPVSLTQPPSETTVTPQMAMLASVLLGLAVYFFRFVWMFVPVSVAMPLRPALRTIAGGVGFSLRTLGVWLLCAVPAMVILQTLLALSFSAMGPDNGTLLGITVVCKVFLDIIKNLLCAAAMTFAFQEIFGGKLKA